MFPKVFFFCVFPLRFVVWSHLIWVVSRDFLGISQNCWLICMDIQWDDINKSWERTNIYHEPSPKKWEPSNKSWETLYCTTVKITTKVKYSKSYLKSIIFLYFLKVKRLKRMQSTWHRMHFKTLLTFIFARPNEIEWFLIVYIILLYLLLKCNLFQCVAFL